MDILPQNETCPKKKTFQRERDPHFFPLKRDLFKQAWFFSAGKEAIISGNTFSLEKSFSNSKEIF